MKLLINLALLLVLPAALAAPAQNLRQGGRRITEAKAAEETPEDRPGPQPEDLEEVDEEHRKLNYYAMCTQYSLWRRGCPYDNVCEEQICALDSYCCRSGGSWDYSCAEKAGRNFRCACPNPDTMMIGKSPKWGVNNEYYVCDYDAETVAHYKCADGQNFYQDGRSGECRSP